MGLPSCFMEKKFVEGQKGDDITPFDDIFSDPEFSLQKWSFENELQEKI
jgi:hypothetical protein